MALGIEETFWPWIDCCPCRRIRGNGKRAVRGTPRLGPVAASKSAAQGFRRAPGHDVRTSGSYRSAPAPSRRSAAHLRRLRPRVGLVRADQPQLRVARRRHRAAGTAGTKEPRRARVSRTITPASTADHTSCAVVVERAEDGRVLLLLKGNGTLRTYLLPEEVTAVVRALREAVGDDGP